MPWRTADRSKTFSRSFASWRTAPWGTFRQWFRRSQSSGRDIEKGLQLDQNVAVLDFERVNGDFRIGIMHGLTGFRIPLPCVPRAHDFSIFDHALTERSALVQADVVHRGIFTIHVGMQISLLPHRNSLASFVAGSSE